MPSSPTFTAGRFETSPHSHVASRNSTASRSPSTHTTTPLGNPHIPNSASPVVETSSAATVTFAELPPTSRTPAIPIVIKTYLIRDINRHNLIAAVHSERTALVRLSTSSSPQIPRLLAAHATAANVTLTLSRATGVPASSFRFPLSVHNACRVLRDIVNALQTVHAHGIVHGDVIARNVVVHVDHNGHEHMKVLSAVLVDFGACFLHDDKQSRDASLTTTPGILAPELCEAKSCVAPTPLVDIWALGILLWTLLAKRTRAGSCDGIGESPPSLGAFLDGTVPLHEAFWRDCKFEYVDGSECAKRVRAEEAFDFVKVCLSTNPLHRFCAVSNYTVLHETAWRDVVDYGRLKAHPFIKNGSEKISV